MKTKIPVNIPIAVENQIPNDFKLPENQRIKIDLSLGAREHQNERERVLLKEIEEIEADGYMLDLPFE